MKVKKNFVVIVTSLILVCGQQVAAVARDWVTPNAMAHSEQLYLIGPTSQPRSGSWIYLTSSLRPYLAVERPCFTGNGKSIDSNGQKISSDNGLYDFCGKEEILNQFAENPSRIRASLQLEVCSSNNDTFCIEEFTFEANGSKTQAVFERYVAEKSSYNHKTPSIPELKIPNGGTPALWRVPGFLHQGGGDTYLSDVRVGIGWDPSGSIKYSQLSMAVVPYSVAPIAKLPTYKKVRTGQQSNVYSVQGKECLGPVFIEGGIQFKESNICPLEEDLAKNIRIGVNIRAPQQIGGWFQGRIGAPEVQVSSISQETKRIMISGGPVTFPKVADIIKKGETGWVRGGTFAFSEDSLGIATTDKALTSLKNSTGDRATGQVTEWAIRAVGSNDFCLTDPTAISGIVTSNALAYQGAPISWNGKYLQFLLGGLHLNADGSVMRGNLDVAINSRVARCLYQISNLPIEAQVQVSYPDGQAINVATHTIREDVTSGFIYLNAKNFTFSNPAIRIYMSNVGDSSQPKSQTLICRKGKLKKSVTGVNPKCPSGYSRTN